MLIEYRSMLSSEGIDRHLTADAFSTHDSNMHLHLICVVYAYLDCLSRCRVPYLIDEYSCAGFKVHHFPVEEGSVPTMADCSDMIVQLRQCISFGHRTLLHCVSGLGISCLAVAILLLNLDELMTPDHVISKLRHIRGQRAFQTVKQYNFIYEFRDLYKAHQENQQNSVEAAPRSLSR